MSTQSEKIPRLTCVSAYIDGWRDVVVLSHGRLYLKGFEAATLSHVSLPTDAKVKVLDYPLTRLLKRLRTNAKTYTVTETVKAAIAELKDELRNRPPGRGPFAEDNP